MPIIVQHQPSPAAVGLAAYTAGLGQASDRKRKEQQALLQQMYDRRFQLGMNQLRYGQEQQLQQERWNQQKQWQDARDEREFQQKQQLANAEARARGEPLPWPDYGSVSQGPMQDRALPGGRQVFEAPDTTITGESGAFGSVAGGSMPSLVTKAAQPGGPMTPYDRQLKLQQEREAQAAKLAEEKEKRAGIRRGDYLVPQDILDDMAQNDKDLAALRRDTQHTPEQKAELRSRLMAKRKELDDEAASRAQPKPRQQAPEEHKLQNGDTLIRQPNGNWLHVPAKPDATNTMTAAQKHASERQDRLDAEKRHIEKEKHRDILEKEYAAKEPELREQITAQVAEGYQQPRATWWGRPLDPRAVTAKEAENDPEIKAEIDRRMAEEKKAWVDGPLERIYPTRPQVPQQPGGATLPAPQPGTTPPPSQTAPSAPPGANNNPNDPTPWLPDWARGTVIPAPATPQQQPPQGRVEVAPGVYADFSGGPVPVQTQADIQALPNGAQWVAPDGQTGSVEKTAPAQQAQTPQVATPQSRAEFDAIPKGTRYRLPDGREGVK